MTIPLAICALVVLVGAYCWNDIVKQMEEERRDLDQFRAFLDDKTRTVKYPKGDNDNA